MAIGEAIPADSQAGPSTPDARTPANEREENLLRELAEALASLKLTVVLFALSILLVLFGTLAQVDHDVWHVVRKTHFRVFRANIELQSIGHLASMTFGGDWTWLKGSVPFPGGITLGALMLLNLTAAHAIRFKANARGARLAGGLMVIALGMVATAAVILSGAGDAIKSDISTPLANGLWHTMRALLAGSALAGLYWLINAYSRIRLPEWIIAALLVFAVVGVTVWLFLNPTLQLDDAGLRILWHLAKASVSTLVLLAGCYLVFGKRAGMVLLHGGVGLLMLGELATYDVDEGQMHIAEGETTNYATDIRTTELAFVETTAKGDTRVSVVPQQYLASAGSNLISHAELPVDLRVLRFHENSVLIGASEELDSMNPATVGAGLMMQASPVGSVSGVSGAGVNQPSTYVEVLDKQTGQSVGVYLASVFRSPQIGMVPQQQVTVGNKTYGMELRFKRLYKPYSIKLLDFQYKRYMATNMAKDFRSRVQLIDPTRNVDRQLDIYMNNPLRYGGDTLYQQDFDRRSERGTVLQVVTNGSWMVPYVSCMVVAFGMLAHFGLTLGTFLRRRTEEANRQQKQDVAQQRTLSQRAQSTLVWVPVLVGLVWGFYLLGKARPVKTPPGEMRIADFGALPLADSGRIKPYDSLARNTLQYLSTRQEVLPPKDSENRERLPAMEWMLGLISDKQGSQDHRVFRIENLDVLDLLKLEPRPGSFRYSYQEVMGADNANRTEIGKQLDLLSQSDESQWSTFQAKMAELGGRLNTYHALAGAFAPIRFSQSPDKMLEDIQLATLDAARRGSKRSSRQMPRAIPPSTPDGKWLTYQEAELNGLFRSVPGVREKAISGLQRFFASSPPIAAQAFREESGELLARLDAAGATPAHAALTQALIAYADEDALAFNSAVSQLQRINSEYEQILRPAVKSGEAADLKSEEQLNLAKIRFEKFFTQFSPFYYCCASYVVAFVLCALSWLYWPRSLGRSATAIIAVTFLFHTFAIIGRIYISGRPPVTNLYSSAVFIGWAVTFVGLAFEGIFRMGLGSLLASVFGFITLLIGHQLSLDGDTYTVLVAVLDTQFWLATHVVCITLGYAATYVAGGLGVIYLIRSHMMSNLEAQAEKTLPKMIYGTLCFAILFSFVGTVLGGLWGDNSWGRFWGWDPKENGALIIVLWNALVLHARWGKMVSSSGLAALSVAGNICTTWSWFGVNELGVGLHAYGGISDKVSVELIILRAVVYSHPLLIAIALVPRKTWRNLLKSAATPTTIS